MKFYNETLSWFCFTFLHQDPLCDFSVSSLKCSRQEGGGTSDPRRWAGNRAEVRGPARCSKALVFWPLLGPDEGTEHCLRSHNCSCIHGANTRVNRNSHIPQAMLISWAVYTRFPLLMPSHPHQSLEKGVRGPKRLFGMWWHKHAERVVDTSLNLA